MKFNDRDISAFWSAKAVKFSTNYHTAFERQEVAHRGLLLSYLEVPTVRQIEVDVVVKDRDKHLLDKTLHDMSDFLISSGEAKLFCDRNRKQYFIARCTEISIPEFAGHTAKFTITFTCSDYRPYDFITNQPIGDASTALSNFTFNGKHCLNNMHCLFVLDNYNLIPKANRNIYVISGRSGTLSYNSQSQALDERAITGTLYFLKADGSTSLMTPQEIDKRAHDVASWLVCAGRKPLTFDSNTDLCIDAEFCEQSNISFDKWENGAVDIKMTVQPYFYEKTEKTKTASLSLVRNAWSTVNVSDVISSVGYTTPLKISITPASPLTELYLHYYDEQGNYKLTLFRDNGFNVAAGQTMVIDGESFNVTIGTDNALKYLLSGDFPVLTPNGNKIIGFRSNSESANISVTMSAKVRWL